MVKEELFELDAIEVKELSGLEQPYDDNMALKMMRRRPRCTTVAYHRAGVRCPHLAQVG